MTTIDVRTTIGGKPIYDAPAGNRQSNWLEVGQGAYPGKGRVLVAAADWPVMTDDANLRLKIWTRTDGAAWTPSTPNLDIPVRVHAATPFLQPADTTDDEGAFLELHIADARFADAHASTVSAAYNVQKAGFPYASGNPEFYPATLNGPVEWTWAGIASQLGLLTTGYTFPSTKPRNLVLDGCSRAEAADRLLELLHACAAYDWTAATRTIVAAGTETAANTALWTAKAEKNPVLRSAPELNDRRYPETLRFQFRVGGSEAPDPYASAARWYAKSIASGYGAAGTTRTIDVGYWFARYSGGSVTNAAELDAIAAFLAAANVIDRWEDFHDTEIPGIVGFKPDGKRRRILWQFNAHRLSTTIRTNSDLPIMPEAATAPRGRRETLAVEPLGATTTARTIDRRTHVEAAAAAEGEFDAIITGNSSAGTNRWKYSWVSAVLTGDVYVRQSPPDREGTIGSDYAINGNETGNTATYKAMGLRLDGPDFPPGMNVIPIGGDYEGFLHDVHVRMRQTVDSSGETRYAFNAPNEVDGPCA